LSCIPFEATFHTKTCDSVLDVICSNCPEKLLTFGQTPASGFSEHDLIFACFDLLTPRFSKQTITYRNFTNINVENLLTDLEEVEWREVYNEKDIDGKVEKFNVILNALMEKHAPIKSKKCKQTSAPWVNNDIRKLCRKRNRLRKRYITKKRPEDLVKFRSVRNRVKQMIRSAKTRYFYAKFQEANDSKALWNTIRSLNVSKSSNKLSDPIINVDELNKHYASVSSVRNERLINSTIIQYGEKIQNEHKTEKFYFKYVLPDLIIKAIYSIKSQAVGVDGINIVFVKMCLPALLPVFDHLFNFSLQNGCFPSIWKQANIIPIPKVKDPKVCKDYRPVSILCLLGKVLEKIVHIQVTEYLNDHDLYASNQSGYRKGHSTITALLKVTDDIREAIDKRLLSFLVLLDLSKAFDCVHHDLLCAKLKYLGFSDSAVTWFNSYLSYRCHRVYVSPNKISEWAEIATGVPQGSVLGPLLFLIYLFDLPEVLESCSYVMYADDIQLYLHFSLSNFTSYLYKLIRDIERVICFCEQHNLLLNVSKTQAIILGTQRFLSMLTGMSLPSLTVNNCVIPFKTSANNLGVIFDTTLSWSEQCTLTAQKVLGILAQLRRSFSFIPPNIRRILIMSLVMPHLDYASVLFTDITDCNNLKLQRLQNACVRFITGASRYEHITPYYTDLGLMKLDQRRIVLIAVLVYKIITTRTPFYLFEKYQFTSSTNMCATRSSKLRLQIPVHRTEKFHLSFFVQSSTIWNELRLFEHVGKSFHCFKSIVERKLQSK